MDDSHETLSYPIGRYEAPERYNPEMQSAWIESIESLPARLAGAVIGLDEQQIDTSYRPGGWTVRQVVHHIADSHMNAYIRHKLSLTEDSPVVKPYDENNWGILPDAISTPVEVSVSLITALHHRWTQLFINMHPEDWNRTYFHPEHERYVPLWELADIYAWHGMHHVAQIKHLRVRNNW